MQIAPMTFTEFLFANGDENLIEYLKSVDDLNPIPDAFFHVLYEKLKMYDVTGGMPESVLMWTEARDVSAMQEALSAILGAYGRDFARHPDLKRCQCVLRCFFWKIGTIAAAPFARKRGKDGAVLAP